MSKNKKPTTTIDDVIAREAATPGFTAVAQVLALERIAQALERIADLAEKASREG